METIEFNYYPKKSKDVSDIIAMGKTILDIQEAIEHKYEDITLKTNYDFEIEDDAPSRTSLYFKVILISSTIESDKQIPNVLRDILLRIPYVPSPAHGTPHLCDMVREHRKKIEDLQK